MLWLILGAALVIFGSIKLVGLFKDTIEKAKTVETKEQIREKVRNSVCAKRFANQFCQMFNPGGAQYQWLMANSNERMYQMSVLKEGIRLTKVEVNRQRLKETGTYDLDTESFGFGASGYADLPNSTYVYEFKRYIEESIETKCPNVYFTDTGDFIKLKETAKIGW